MAEKEIGKGLVEMQPDEVQFKCPDCGLQCLLHPRAQPMNVQHEVTKRCFTWKKIENVTGEEKQELLLSMLKRADLPVIGGGRFIS